MNENAPPTGKRAAGLSRGMGRCYTLPTRLHFADFDGRIRTAMPPTQIRQGADRVKRPTRRGGGRPIDGSGPEGGRHPGLVELVLPG
jgi:hypothetical protein